MSASGKNCAEVKVKSLHNFPFDPLVLIFSEHGNRSAVVRGVLQGMVHGQISSRGQETWLSR